MNPNEMTATTAAKLIRSGELASRALIESCLARIDAREVEISAWAFLDPELALSQADAADRVISEGGNPGPLHGVPVGIKDIIDTADMPTEHGSALFVGRRPREDAAAVAALRAAGAVILGKTVTTELANTNPAATKNPHNLEHTPGGSSAGSAAGVADFHMPLALGTQTGGSVIRPASFNGIYGLKPTRGLIPRRGTLLQSHTLDTIGVYGRCIEDLALVTDPLSIPDPTDAEGFEGVRPGLIEALEKTDDASPRFAFLKTPAWDAATHEAQVAIQGFAKGLEDACISIDLDPPFDRVCTYQEVVMAAENDHFYGSWLREQPDKFSPMLSARLEASRSVRTSDYIEALRARDTLYDQVNDVLGRVDAILCLSAPGPAPQGFATTGNAIFNGLWTYLGVPCLSLPLLEVGGMPLGVQLIGARGGEAALLQAGVKLERLINSA